MPVFMVLVMALIMDLIMELIMELIMDCACHSLKASCAGHCPKVNALCSASLH
jgi:hypothetical protein